MKKSLGKECRDDLVPIRLNREALIFGQHVSSRHSAIVPECITYCSLLYSSMSICKRVIKASCPCIPKVFRDYLVSGNTLLFQAKIAKKGSQIDWELTAEVLHGLLLLKPDCLACGGPFDA